MIKRLKNPFSLAGAGLLMGAVVAVALFTPILIGGFAGWLLGYGFAKGAGAGIVFSMVVGGVRGVLGMAYPQQSAPQLTGA